MAADREPPTLVDYVVTGISPVLIMLMVGSLVFFLVEVLYAGQYSGRLLYTLFFFVLGAVLVARIAIQYDAARATMYGLGLGAAVYLALNAYVEYPPGSPVRGFGWLVNLGLMVLTWWAAHKLTWDCTYVDDKKEASGRGVLAAAGLDADAKEGSEPEGGRDARRSTEPEPASKKKKRKRREPVLWGWIERYKAHRTAQQEKARTPGVWVIYFALAALPLFALGQSLISQDDADRRRATFFQMAVYVGSALALLATTALLGLRQYLKQRKAKMPPALTASWLGLGGVLIVVFLLLGAFLPRPHSEVPWFGLVRAGKSDREASKYAQLRGSAGKGEGAAGDQTEAGDGKASGKGGKPGGSRGEKGDGGGDGDGEGGQSDGGKQGGDGKGGSKSGESGGKKQSRGGKDDRRSGDGGRTDRDAGEAKDSSGDGDRSSGSSSPQGGVMAAVEKVAGFLKWVIYAIIVFLVLVGIALAVLRYLAPFTNWARNLLDALRNWWAGLFGGRAKKPRPTEEAREESRGFVRPPPFASFSNPFADGTADGRDTAELVEYTFAALDAWASDRGHGRHPQETPLEFAARLGGEFAGQATASKQLANLYARLAYATTPLPKDTPAQLEAVWEQLVHGAPEPEFEVVE
jgi:hypothetical protein